MAKTSLGEIQERIKQYLKIRADVASAEAAASQAAQALGALRDWRKDQRLEIVSLLEEVGLTIGDQDLALAFLSEGVVAHTRRQRGGEAQPAVQEELPSA